MANSKKRAIKKQSDSPKMMELTSEDHALLLNWYQQNQRLLPWRNSNGLGDPYAVWVSEVMLQQTTVAAVVPFFEKFMNRFPNVQSLANTKIEEVLPYWAGLGYYSRIRNLHKAAAVIASSGFPKTSHELLKLPGIGPYTANAIASIAFGENVGVLDGNVNRVLTRKLGFTKEWWTNESKAFLQLQADFLARLGSPEKINQALMELGAIICTPQKVQCGICPWNRSCKALYSRSVDQIPRAKPRKQFEIWHWQVVRQGNLEKIQLIKNDQGPVLKGTWVFPGEFTKLSKRPEKYELIHTITHHKIYISFINNKTAMKTQINKAGGTLAVSPRKLSQVNPSIVLQKIISKMGERELV